MTMLMMNRLLCLFFRFEIRCYHACKSEKVELLHLNGVFLFQISLPRAYGDAQPR